MANAWRIYWYRKKGKKKKIYARSEQFQTRRMAEELNARLVWKGQIKKEKKSLRRKDSNG